MNYMYGRRGGAYAAWGLVVAAGLTCAVPLATWRHDEFVFPEHTVDTNYSASIPSTGTISIASSTYASLMDVIPQMWGIR